MIGLEQGDGQPVVPLHGFPAYHKTWDYVEPLPRDFKVVVPDLRGYYRSDKPIRKSWRGICGKTRGPNEVGEEGISIVAEFLGPVDIQPSELS